MKQIPLFFFRCMLVLTGSRLSTITIPIVLALPVTLLLTFFDTLARQPLCPSNRSYV